MLSVFSLRSTTDSPKPQPQISLVQRRKISALFSASTVRSIIDLILVPLCSVFTRAFRRHGRGQSIDNWLVSNVQQEPKRPGCTASWPHIQSQLNNSISLILSIRAHLPVPAQCVRPGACLGQQVHFRGILIGWISEASGSGRQGFPTLN